MKRILPGALLLAVLGCPGCASVLGRTTFFGNPPDFYHGVQVSVMEILLLGVTEDVLETIPVRVFFLLDLPLTLAADTVLVPVDLVVWLGFDGWKGVMTGYRPSRHVAD